MNLLLMKRLQYRWELYNCLPIRWMTKVFRIEWHSFSIVKTIEINEFVSSRPGHHHTKFTPDPNFMALEYSEQTVWLAYIACVPFNDWIPIHQKNKTKIVELNDFDVGCAYRKARSETITEQCHDSSNFRCGWIKILLWQQKSSMFLLATSDFFLLFFRNA